MAYDIWSFSTTFSAAEAAALAREKQVVLFLGGVDTVADVMLNGHQLLRTDNFHRCVAAHLKTRAQRVVHVAHTCLMHEWPLWTRLYHACMRHCH